MMKSDAQLREDIIRDLPETTDLVERVARALSEAGGAANWEHALECAKAALEAAGVPALQARVAKLEMLIAEVKTKALVAVATDAPNAFWFLHLAEEIDDARAALAEDYCGIVEVNEEDFTAEGER